MKKRKLAILGVPTSAGGNSPGMENAPGWLRRLGLPQQMVERGVSLLDMGDLPLFPYQADPDPRSKTRNLTLVANCAKATRDRVADFLSSEQPFLLLGGDCTISVGAVAALAKSQASFGVLYIDGHLDLNDPETWFSGIMDGTGVAHMLGRGAELLNGLAGQVPMLAPNQISYLGTDRNRIENEEAELAEAFDLPITYADAVIADQVAAFDRAVAPLSRFKRIYVHLDIDVLHFPTFPIAHVPEYGASGLDTTQLTKLLCRAFALPNFAGCAVTEINPDRDPERIYGPQVNAMLADAAAQLSTAAYA